MRFDVVTLLPEMFEAARLGVTGRAFERGLAYEDYLRGMYIWQREPDALESLNQARQYFESALALDPAYDDALWGLFSVWDRMNRNGHLAFNDSLEQMGFYVKELERLAPGSDRALGAAARFALVNYQHDRAIAYLEEAARKYPGSAIVQGEFASVLSTLGHYDEALRASENRFRIAARHTAPQAIP